MTDAPEPIDGELVGQVRAFQSRSEPVGDRQRTVWSFRVERFDEDGNLMLRAPVEMSGLSFRGSIAEGDSVRVTGRHRRGTVRARRVENLTTGATIEARDQPFVVTLVGSLIAIAIVVAFVLFAVLMVLSFV